MTINALDHRDPFAAVRDRLPTRYAPGFNAYPYQYPTPDRWYPVIYYIDWEGEPGDSQRILLVEPYPAERADDADGCNPGDRDPGDCASVAVLTGRSIPRPRGADRNGDWIIPGLTLPTGSADCAYHAHVTSQADLLAAWCEAYAIATALNNGTVDALGLKPEDVEVLLAAERADLTGDSRFAGTIHELWWKRIEPDRRRGDGSRIGARQAKRLRAGLAAIEAGTTRERHPNRPELSTSGREWTETTYRLTRAGADMLASIRRQYDGPTRCRVCGCTQERACPGSCAWADADLCTSCVGDDPVGPAADFR